MPTKSFDDALTEAMTAAQAVLSFYGYGEKVISKVGLADRSKIDDKGTTVVTELNRECCLWDCTITNGGACTCRRWC